MKTDIITAKTIIQISEKKDKINKSEIEKLKCWRLYSWYNDIDIGDILLIEAEIDTLYFSMTPVSLLIKFPKVSIMNLRTSRVKKIDMNVFTKLLKIKILKIQR